MSDVDGMSAGPRGPTEDDPFSSLHDEPILDLRAVEARSRDARLAKEDVAPLLVHCRALRAALREMLDLNYKWSPTREGESTRSSRAAAVLRGAQDQEG